ncbi:MAG: hypothetical protein KDA85_03485, partial [Planctomycetaceae bacterium]|nr:hypothetical protein [Planctomycetaceae bacterium]
YFASGFQVTKVAPHSPAAVSGIEVGDILLGWEGNQLFGEDPNQPFGHYSHLQRQLSEMLEKYEKHKGWASYSTNFDLLDHRSGEVVRVHPSFGFVAGGNPGKSDVVRRIEERKRLRSVKQ